MTDVSSGYTFFHIIYMEQMYMRYYSNIDFWNHGSKIKNSQSNRYLFRIYILPYCIYGTKFLLEGKIPYYYKTKGVIFAKFAIGFVNIPSSHTEKFHIIFVKVISETLKARVLKERKW